MPPSTHRHDAPVPRAARLRWTAVAVAAGLAAGAAANAAAGAADVGIPAPEQVTSTATPTHEAWEPEGTWRAWHAHDTDPLWTRDAPELRGVHGVRDGDAWIGWAVGTEGALAHYDGDVWRPVREFEPARTQPLTYTFNDVFVAAPDSVWVVGEVEGDRFCDGCGTVLRYDGREWYELDRLSYGVNGRVGAFNAIDMLQDEEGGWYGWIVGDDADFDRFKAVIIGHRPDSGWRIWQAHNIAKHLYDVRLVSPSEAWAVGQHGVESRYNEDRGEGIWPPLGRSGADDLFAVDLNDALDGWDGGFRGRMNKYKGHCHDDDPATTCWFQNQAIPLRGPTGSLWAITIRAIELQARNQGWLVGDVNGRTSTVAYMSDEVKWTVVPVEQDPGRSLLGLYMDSPAWGVAVGADGTILKYRAAVPPTATSTQTPTATPTETAPPTPTATAEATLAPSVTASVTAVGGTPTPTATVSTETPEATSTRPTSTPTPVAWPSEPLYLPLLSRQY